MKKSLVIALLAALGITSGAYAANPFSDVPAGHWAYDAVNKLAAEGVIDGYPDGTYGGDKLMTRYEMAQIIAKAMAKGANVDKLAAEFADELDSLGVRVANLEKKSDNVKITGEIRASYRFGDGNAQTDEGYLRTRLYATGQVNEDWSWTGRFENFQYYDGIDRSGNDDDLILSRAYVSGRIGGIDIEAGRQSFIKPDVSDSKGDGIKLTYGDKIKVYGWVQKASSAPDWVGGEFLHGGRNMEDGDRIYFAGIEGKFDALDAALRYYKADNQRENEIYELSLTDEILKKLYLKGVYYYGDMDTDLYSSDNNGYIIGLSYRGAKASDVGSYGLYANYNDRPMSTYLRPSIFAGGYSLFPSDVAYTENDYYGDGYKGWDVGANYTVAKNMVAGIKYSDFKSRNGNEEGRALWTEVVFTF